ncbi:50S ribosomal protein L33 [Candidatus Clavichlamydia salmonicola]|nr:50S ribosomal protein L33 [Candidatus Clavichlamydia salmonicola]
MVFDPILLFLSKPPGYPMASKQREIIKLKSSESTDVYWTIKNRRNTTGRLELKKFDKKLRRHVIFKEAK